MIVIPDSIKIRRSVRNYTGAILDPQIKQKIIDEVCGETRGPLGNPVVVTFISPDDLNGKIGTYGMITGAKHYIIGQSGTTKNNFLDFGYCFENAVLKLTAMGLGTCWIGGTMNRTSIKKHRVADSKYPITCISPVGYARPKNLKEKIVRKLAKSDGRKNIEELLLFNNCEYQAEVIFHLLEAVRLSPSASNLQPWRFGIKNIEEKFFQIDFYLQRKPGYSNVVKNIDLQMIDIGIAMYHLDLIIAQNKISAAWEIKDDISLPGYEYIITKTISVEN